MSFVVVMMLRQNRLYSPWSFFYWRFRSVSRLLLSSLVLNHWGVTDRFRIKNAGKWPRFGRLRDPAELPPSHGFCGYLRAFFIFFISRLGPVFDPLPTRLWSLKTLTPALICVSRFCFKNNSKILLLFKNLILIQDFI